MTLARNPGTGSLEKIWVWNTKEPLLPGAERDETVDRCISVPWGSAMGLRRRGYLLAQHCISCTYLPACVNGEEMLRDG